jgi:ketosteroid isomerase-like protein
MKALEMTTKETFRHHLEAFGKNDLDELMKDYTEQSEVWTPEGPIAGLDAIASFFSYAFTLFPKDATRLEIKQMIAKGDKLYVVWDADSPVVSVPIGTDSFEIIDGIIVWQSTAIHIIQK